MKEKITYEKLEEAYNRLLDLDNELALEHDGLQKKDSELSERYKRLLTSHKASLECLRDALEYIKYKEASNELKDYQEKSNSEKNKANL